MKMDKRIDKLTDAWVEFNRWKMEAKDFCFLFSDLFEKETSYKWHKISLGRTDEELEEYWANREKEK